MLAILIYFLKVICCSAVLYLYYLVALRNKVFHAYNRFYLMAMILLSATLPLFQFSFIGVESASPGLINVLSVVGSGNTYLDEVIIQSSYNHFTWQQGVGLFFVLVSSIMLIHLLISLWMIYRLRSQNPVQQIEDIYLIETTAKESPFSFFKNIFWNTELDIRSEDGRRVLAHEIAHVRENHSFDKIFVNIALIIFWCNPIFWLARHELHMIHEFLADKKAVEDGDTASFAAMVLAAAYPQHQFRITNNFFYSPIKRRLAMLTKNNRNRLSYFSRLLILPVAAILFTAFSIRSQRDNIAPVKLKEKITVVIDAGHGGTDGGAFANGVYEKDLTLELVKKIKALNENDNIEIILSRTGDENVLGLRERVADIVATNPDLVISVHVNNTAKKIGDKSGLEVMVARDSYENTAMSKVFASAMLQSFKNTYGLPVSEAPIQRKLGTWILQEPAAPTILIEAGYMNNKNDLMFLQSAAGQEAFAKNVLNAIELFAFNKENVGVAVQSVRDSPPPPQSISIKAVKVNMESKVDSKLLQGVLIIDGKVVDKAKYQNKNISAGEIVFYDKPTPEQLAKYGAEANKGVTLVNGFKGATDVVEVRNNYSLTADSMRIIAEQRDSRYGSREMQANAATGAGKNPFFVIDGKPAGKGALDNIKPNDIKSINVLKGPSAIALYGDNGKDGAIQITLKSDRDMGENKIFTQVEQEAEFPGGAAQWRKYLEIAADPLVPINAGMKPGSYTVMMKFIVDKDGSLRDIEAESYIGTAIAKHCIGVIAKGPKWIPAKQNDRVVAAYRKQPITFIVAE